ncbi:MAG TPA: hypothetical protein PKW33_13060 [Anaerolineaceae bacterium]|nr:hypothetical protein [Anaerolineaceae bacterium]HPN52513.1 hypothetical protein [Anaerolineaceae bacterium]
MSTTQKTLIVILGGLIIAFVLLMAAALVTLAFKNPATPGPAGDPLVTVIPAQKVTSKPTTATPAPGVTPAIIATPEPQTTPTATPQPGSIAVGVYVKITGTEGGLRLRAEPGLNGAALFLGYDDEAFKVEDGPREADGYIWWYLQAPYDKTRRGWAVGNYLQVVDTLPAVQP